MSAIVLVLFILELPRVFVKAVALTCVEQGLCRVENPGKSWNLKVNISRLGNF